MLIVRIVRRCRLFIRQAQEAVFQDAPAALALTMPSSWRSRRRFVTNSVNTPSMSRKHLPAADLEETEEGYHRCSRCRM